MADQCTPGLPGTLTETVVLAIELVGNQVKNSPENLIAILKSPAVQKKIRDSLEKRLGELQKKALTGNPVDSSQALQEIKAVFTADTMDTAIKEYKKSLEQSYSFRQLKSSLDSLKCEFKERPLGAIVDEASGVLVVLAAGAIIAGAVGIYVVATGDEDTPMAALGKLAEQIVIPIGKVEVGLTNIELKPSEKKYDAGLFVKIENWKALKSAEIKIVAQTKDEKVAALPISVETNVRLTDYWFLTNGLSSDLNQQQMNFKYSLGIKGKVGDSLSVELKANLANQNDAFTYGGSANVAWRPVRGTDLEITGGFSTQSQSGAQNPALLNSNPSSGTKPPGTNVNFGLVWHFD